MASVVGSPVTWEVSQCATWSSNLNGGAGVPSTLLVGMKPETLQVVAFQTCEGDIFNSFHTKRLEDFQFDNSFQVDPDGLLAPLR